jgi:hypothetical protein
MSLLGCLVSTDIGSRVNCDPGGEVYLAGTALVNCLLVMHYGRVNISDRSVIITDGAPGSNAVLIDDGSFFRVEDTVPWGVWLGIFDWTSGGALVAFQEASRGSISGEVWGLNNTCAWFYQVGAGCQVVSDVIAYVSGLGGVAGTADTVIATNTKAYGALPYVDLSTLTSISTL